MSFGRHSYPSIEQRLGCPSWTYSLSLTKQSRRIFRRWPRFRYLIIKETKKFLCSKCLCLSLGSRPTTQRELSKLTGNKIKQFRAVDGDRFFYFFASSFSGSIKFHNSPGIQSKNTKSDKVALGDLSSFHPFPVGHRTTKVGRTVQN